MNYFVKITALLFIVIAGGCAAVDGYKYALTGKQAEPPPRTIEAAQAQFNDSGLVIAKSTEADIKTLLGSPSEIKKEGTNKIYIYMKNVSTKGVSVDVGTIYVASYTFNSSGKLSDKEYVARPMSNPLTGK